MSRESLDVGGDASKDEWLQSTHGQSNGTSCTDDLYVAVLLSDLLNQPFDARASHLEDNAVALDSIKDMKVGRVESVRVSLTLDCEETTSTHDLEHDVWQRSGWRRG